MYCDLHGHSGKKNVFVYGCEGGSTPRLHERVFPKILSHAAGVFSFENCSFKVQKEKESTGR